MEGSSFFQRLKQGLTKSRESWAQKLGDVFQSRRWDETTMELMEEQLISADVGIHATEKLVAVLRQQSPRGAGDMVQDMSSRLQETMIQMLQPVTRPASDLFSARPWIMIFLGVNGVGKTTTIGKLAAQYRRAGKKVLLVAADTFRAAAIEQLQAWGESVGVDVIKHRPGSDPSAVVFDGMQAAKNRGAD
ncbi:MAG TPA: signal recognition particle receptor subunit alpha, partial [Candidatus Binatia bacterium]|nr:signal recognition particle receptor subunit alpha [Candidatus Binatia bacterium]